MAPRAPFRANDADDGRATELTLRLEDNVKYTLKKVKGLKN